MEDRTLLITDREWQKHLLENVACLTGLEVDEASTVMEWSRVGDHGVSVVALRVPVDMVLSIRSVYPGTGPAEAAEGGE